MKTLLTILLATLCAATSYGQTIKALSYNTANNAVVQPSVLSVFDFGAAGLRANAAEFGSGLFVFAAAAPWDVVADRDGWSRYVAPRSPQ